MPCKREQVAEALGYSADVVKQIENGTYRASVEHYIAEWARVYGLDDELRELWERVREAREVERTYPNSRVEHSTRGSWRDLINSAAHESGDHASVAETTGIRPVALEQLGSEVIRIARAYPVAPPFSLFADMLRVRNRVYWLLDHTRRPDQQRDLYLIASQICGLLAGVSFDLGQPKAAAEQARATYTYAHLIGHNELRAWADGMLATVAFWSGRPQDAIALVERGRTYTPAGVPTVRLLCIGARAAAYVDDADTTRGAILAAKRARDDADGRSELHDSIGGNFRFDDARQAFSNGSALLRIGDVKAARQECETAVLLYGQDREARRGYAARVDLASTFLLAGDLDGASETLDQVFALAPDKRVATVVKRLNDVSGRLSRPPFRGAQQAILLDERIESFVVDTALRELPARRR
jgi:tetratricopeptide (TPR) repeat protein